MAKSKELTPKERTLRASLAAHAKWAQYDSREHTKAARAGFMARFEREVDPDRTLPETERQRRAEHALRAHMKRLALASSKARRRAS